MQTMTKSEQARADAMADAETLRLFADEAWTDSSAAGPDLYDTPDHQASNLLLILDMTDLRRGGRLMRHVNRGRGGLSWAITSDAAHAAFRAVPGLR